MLADIMLLGKEALLFIGRPEVNKEELSKQLKLKGCELHFLL